MNGQTLYIKALFGRAEVYHFIGRLPQSMADLEKVMASERAGDHEQDALARLSALYGALGDCRRELHCANKLIAITRDRDLCSRGKALIIKAGALRDQGNYASSLKVADRSVSLFRSAQKIKGLSRRDRQKIQENIGNSYKTMGMVHNLLGKYDLSLAFFNKSLKIAEMIDNRTEITHLLNNIGLIYWHKGKFAKARNHFSKSFSIAMKIGYKNVVAVTLGNLGLIYNEIEKYNIALEYFHKALKISEEIGNKTNMANNLNNIGMCFSNECDFNNAIKYYLPSLNIFRKIGNKFGIAFTLNNIGGIYFERGAYKKALDCIKEAENIALRAGLSEIIIRGRTLKARIWRARREYAKSNGLLRKTIAFAEKSKMKGLMFDAVVHYVKTAIEREKRVQPSDLADYIAFLEKNSKKATLVYEKCFILITLIRHNIVEKKFDVAKKKFSKLSRAIKKTKDKKFFIESLLIHARLNIATGRKYDHLLRKARVRARQIGSKYLLDEIKDCARAKKT